MFGNTLRTNTFNIEEFITNYKAGILVRSRNYVYNAQGVMKEIIVRSDNSIRNPIGMPISLQEVEEFAKVPRSAIGTLL